PACRCWRRPDTTSAALRRRLQTVAHVLNFREHVEDGDLMSYGIALRQNYRRGAYFVDRILKGEKPGDLPIEFPTKVELVVNVTTAKAIGRTPPDAARPRRRGDRVKRRVCVLAR